MRKLIKNRQSEIDDDASNSEEFLQEILDHLKYICLHQNRKIKAVEIIQHDKMVEILKVFLGKHIASNIVSKTISSMGLPSLKQVVEKGRSRYWIFRLDGQKLTHEQLEAGYQNHHDWLNTIDLTESDNQDDESYDGEGEDLTLEEIEDESPNHNDWLTSDLPDDDNLENEFYYVDGHYLTYEEFEAGYQNHHDWLNTIDLTESDNQDDEFPD